MINIYKLKYYCRLAAYCPVGYDYQLRPLQCSLQYSYKETSKIPRLLGSLQNRKTVWFHSDGTELCYGQSFITVWDFRPVIFVTLQSTELFRGCLSSFCSLHIIYFTSNRIVLCNQRNIGENFLISWHCAKWHLIYLDYFPKQTTAFYLYWWKLHPLCNVLSCFVCLANIRGLQGISQNQVYFEW